MNSELMRKQLNYSVTSNEILDALNHQCLILRYLELITITTIEECFLKTNRIIILLENDKEKHYVSLILNASKKELYYYDSYGISINEANKELGINDNKLSMNIINFINRHGYKFHVNNIEMQGREVNTCGRWAIISSYFNKMNNEQFNNFIDSIFSNRYKRDEKIIYLSMCLIPTPLEKYTDVKNESYNSYKSMELINNDNNEYNNQVNEGYFN